VLNVNYGVVSALKTKFAERSGYVIGMHGGNWHPTKIAEGGHSEMSDFYAFYRTAVSSVPFSDFVKCAYAVPAVRELPRQRDPLEAAAFVANTGLV
jgi:hypothetical protein